MKMEWKALIPSTLQAQVLNVSQDHGFCQETRGPESVPTDGQEDVS